MKSIGTYELKAHLSRVLSEVEGGEHIVVTRNGEPIAELIPHAKRREFDAIIGDIQQLRNRSKKVTREELMAWRHEGHRF